MTKAWIVAAALAGLTLFARSAQASTITLTGGDPGEGYAPLSSTFGALDLGGLGGFIVQGVDFTASDPHIALSPVLSGQAAVLDLGNTANDNSLDAILFTIVGQQPGPFTLTVTGLTVGTSYQFDYFLGLVGDNRTVQFSAAGQTTVVDSVVLPDGLAVDVRQLVTPDPTGQIVVTVSAIAGFPSPILSGLSITSDQAATPVPEPASLLLLGTVIAGIRGGRLRGARQHD